MENLVDNKHLQLQLLLIQFLSVALADSADNNVDEIGESSNQTTAKNQIAGKVCNSLMLASSNYHSALTHRLSLKLAKATVEISAKSQLICILNCSITSPRDLLRISALVNCRINML